MSTTNIGEIETALCYDVVGTIFFDFELKLAMQIENISFFSTYNCDRSIPCYVLDFSYRTVQSITIRSGSFYLAFKKAGFEAIFAPVGCIFFFPVQTGSLLIKLNCINK